MIERDYLTDPRRNAHPDFDRGIGVAETHAASPVRNIPVTAAMRQADARRSVLASPTAIAWRSRIFGEGRSPAPAPEKKPQTMHLTTRTARRFDNSTLCSDHCGRVTLHSSGRCCQCRKRKASEVAA